MEYLFWFFFVAESSHGLEEVFVFNAREYKRVAF